jgi:hypothetical protein
MESSRMRAPPFEAPRTSVKPQALRQETSGCLAWVGGKATNKGKGSIYNSEQDSYMYLGTLLAQIKSGSNRP